MRGKDLLHDLSFIDDDLVQEAASDEMPECFKKGNKAGKGANDANAGSRSRQRSRRRLIAMAACLMLAVGVTAGLSQTDMWSWIHTGESSDSGAHDKLQAGAPYDDELDAGTVSGASDDTYKKSDTADASAADGGVDVNEDTADRAYDKNTGVNSSNEAQKENSGKKYAAGRPSESSSSGSRHDAGIMPGGSGSSNSGANGSDASDIPVMSPSPGASDSENSSDVNHDSEDAGDAEYDTSAGNASSGSGGGAANGSQAAGNSVITSDELSAYLSGLEYSGSLSSAGSEYTVSGGNGTVYYINLTEGFARTANGEAKLTADQVKHIKNVMSK